MAYGENIFTGIIDEEGVIWEAGTGRKRQAVGIDSQKEQEYINTITEMQETIDNYYSKLVELGVIKQPKTPEQIAQEAAEQQAQINQSLLEAIQGLKSEIKELKSNGNVGNGDEPSLDTVRQNSASNRQKSARSKGSNNPSAKDDTRNSK